MQARGSRLRNRLIIAKVRNAIMMDKFQAAMEKTLIPLANKLSASRILRAISGGFSALLPIIMVGAIASLLSG